jgi:hypothetical protein
MLTAEAVTHCLHAVDYFLVPQQATTSKTTTSKTTNTSQTAHRPLPGLLQGAGITPWPSQAAVIHLNSQNAHFAAELTSTSASAKHVVLLLWFFC